MNPRELPLERITALPITHEATIPEEFLDEMGHMNVMWYTHLFSNAMGGLFQRIGLDAAHMKQHNTGTFALETHTRYLSEVRVGHSVAVHTRLVARSAKRFHVVHFMVNRTKEDLAAIFETVGTHIDMTIRRSSEFPESIADQLKCLIEQHQRLEWEVPVCGSMQA